ncbi:MAG: lysophospholipid acyltransferase family protein [Planctomycetia bacterium]|nr:lysophospholipid acyltransferase family protein [Planctomycetia bacterium]
MTQAPKETTQAAGAATASGGKSGRKSVKKRHVSCLHQAWYQFCRLMVWLVMTPCFRLCHRKRRHIPWHGPVLVVANHQSFLDPPAIGCGVFRRMNYLARKTLFRFKPFGWLIDSVDAIPLDQEGIGFAGIKECLRRLNNGEVVLIFPEGARSETGELQPFRTGYINLAIKTKSTIVPTAIAGAYEVFPRGKKFPSFFGRPVRVEYGKPITPDDYASMSEAELHALVESKVREIFERIRRKKTTSSDRK